VKSAHSFLIAAGCVAHQKAADAVLSAFGIAAGLSRGERTCTPLAIARAAVAVMLRMESAGSRTSARILEGGSYALLRGLRVLVSLKLNRRFS
jgi:hypothetical protein